MAIRPRTDRVLVRMDPIEEVTPGGIVMPGKRKTGWVARSGKILAVGPGFVNRDGKVIPIGLEVGARVLIEKDAGIQANEGDELLLLVDSGEILAEVTEG